MSDRLLLKRVGAGMVVAAYAALAASELLEATEPQRTAAEMDVVQRQMELWGGTGWSLRHHSQGRVSQIWFIKVEGPSDRDLINMVYDLGGYDRLSGCGPGFRMSVDISSAPPSEWRVARVTIERAS